MSIIYQLKMATGQYLRFEIHNRKGVNPAEMNARTDVPEWAKLENYQCTFCSYKIEDITYCPAAFDLQDIIAQCCNYISYEKVEISRITDESTVVMNTDMQKALFAVIAERAISSACTVLNSRQWTVNYYSIPTTVEKLLYRSISSYLVQQLVMASANHESDFQLKDHLGFINEPINIFRTLFKRVRNVCPQDANNNAIVKVVAAGELMKMKRDEWLDELKNEMGV
jgi:hypothetical protein